MEVAEVSLTPERTAEIQTELAEKLFTDQRLSETETGEAE
jgi:cytochrome c peroxidase